jgi:MFS family permease
LAEHRTRKKSSTALLDSGNALTVSPPLFFEAMPPGLLAQAFGAIGYVFVRELAAFYAVAALFGFIYAGTMPLYASLARENFPLRMMGTVIGGTAMAGSLGMATGPLAGGLIYDTFASYAWLYIGSWIMGLGAFLIALTFRPVPMVRPAPVPA